MAGWAATSSPVAHALLEIQWATGTVNPLFFEKGSATVSVRVEDSVGATFANCELLYFGHKPQRQAEVL